MRANLITGVTALLLLSDVCFGVQSDYHIFKDVQDRTVIAKIIHVDVGRGLVELELENKRRTKVNPSIFCEADQAYIRDWGICKSFMSSSGLRFRCEKEVIEDWNESLGAGVNREYEKNVYNCELKNGSSAPYVEVHVEYCVYWVQEIPQDGGEQRLENDYAGSYTIDCIDPRATVKFQTDPVTLVYQYLQGGYYYENGATGKQSSKMKGVWLKVSIATPSGQTATREFCEPTTVMQRQVWKAPGKNTIDKEAQSNKKGKNKNRR